MQKWIIIAVIAIILILTTVIVLNVDIETEYTPETEIEETELRKTIISLYFLDKNTMELVKESRLIDSKELIINPYDKVLEMMISGPENDSYTRTIPENTKVIETKLESDCLVINFSSEFSGALTDDTNKEKIIESIYQSLKEFTEINSIKILVENVDINGESEISDEVKNLVNNQIIENTISNEVTNQTVENM